MLTEIRYIELKSGYSDDGPAWIGRVALSKTGNTVYFNNKAFQKWQGVSGNFYDIETGEEYWISGIKKNGADRHWAGHGKVILQDSIVLEYLPITGTNELNKSKYEVADIPDSYPVERIRELENRRNNDET